MAHRAQVEAILKQHNPAALGQIDVMLGKYEGREGELVKALNTKYGAPAAPAGAAGPKKSPGRKASPGAPGAGRKTSPGAPGTGRKTSPGAPGTGRKSPGKVSPGAPGAAAPAGAGPGKKSPAPGGPKKIAAQPGAAPAAGAPKKLAPSPGGKTKVASPSPGAPTKVASPSPAAPGKKAAPGAGGASPKKLVAPPAGTTPGKKAPASASPKKLKAPVTPGAKSPGPAAGGPAPAAPGAKPAADLTLQPPVTAFYQKYAPEKVANVKTMLETFAGREEVMFDHCEKQYSCPGHFAKERAALLTKRNAAAAAPVSPVSVPPEPVAPTTPVVTATPVTTTPTPEVDPPVAAVPVEGQTPPVQAAVSGKVPPDLTLQPIMTTFYQKYAPQKVANVKTMLATFAGREEAMFDHCEKQYSCPGFFAKQRPVVRARAVSLSQAQKTAAMHEATAGAEEIRQNTAASEAQVAAEQQARADSAAIEAAMKAEDERQALERIQAANATAAAAEQQRLADQIAEIERQKAELKEREAMTVEERARAEQLETREAAFRAERERLQQPGVGSSTSMAHLPAFESSDDPRNFTGPGSMHGETGFQEGAPPQSHMIGGGGRQGTTFPNDQDKQIAALQQQLLAAGTPSSPLVDIDLTGWKGKAVAFADFYGIHRLAVQRILQVHGDDEPKVMFDLLCMAFPDGVMNLLDHPDQQVAFNARRLSHFFAYHNPSRLSKLGDVLSRYEGHSSTALGDVILKYYKNIFSSVAIPHTSKEVINSSIFPAIADDWAAERPMYTPEDAARSVAGGGGGIVMDPETAKIAFASGGGSGGLKPLQHSIDVNTDQWPPAGREIGIQTENFEPLRISTMIETEPERVHRDGPAYDRYRSDVQNGSYNELRQRRQREMYEDHSPHPFDVPVSLSGGNNMHNVPSSPTGPSSHLAFGLGPSNHANPLGLQAGGVNDFFSGSSSPLLMRSHNGGHSPSNRCGRCTQFEEQLNAAKQKLYLLRSQQQMKERYDSFATGGSGGLGHAQGCNSCTELKREVRSLTERLHNLRMNRHVNPLTIGAGGQPGTMASDAIVAQTPTALGGRGAGTVGPGGLQRKYTLAEEEQMLLDAL